MDKERKLIIAGNWKMNKTVAESLDLANGLVRELKDVTEVDIAICPPFTALAAVSEIVIDSNIRLGAQNMNQNGYGAHTGEIAAGMLKEFSAKYVILGHSERRQYQRESDELVAAKAKAAHEAGLKTDRLCGRTTRGSRKRPHGGGRWFADPGQPGRLDHGSNGGARSSLTSRSGRSAPAKRPPPGQAQEVHAFIRNLLGEIFDEDTARHVRIQYGGSVKPGNARELMGQPDVDGALVGGASLDARNFSEIILNSI